MNWLKLIAIILVVIVIVNMALFALQIITGLIFWAVIIVIALIAYKGIPSLKTKLEKSKH